MMMFRYHRKKRPDLRINPAFGMVHKMVSRPVPPFADRYLHRSAWAQTRLL